MCIYKAKRNNTQFYAMTFCHLVLVLFIQSTPLIKKMNVGKNFEKKTHCTFFRNFLFRVYYWKQT